MRLSPKERRLLEMAAELRDAKPHDISRTVLMRWARRVLANGGKA